MQKYFTFDDCQLVPQYSEILSRSNCDIESQLTRNYKIQVPIIASPMDTVCGLDMAKVLYDRGAVGVIHRFMTIAEQGSLVRQLSLHAKRNPLRDKVKQELSQLTPVIAAAIGATDDYLERATTLLYEGANVLVIDVAHGHHIHVKNAIRNLKNTCAPVRKFDIIAGNVATAEAARALEEWGADCIRVGIGGGSVCSTRVTTGVGVPQFSAVLECSKAVNVPVISDGGIRYIGDMAKAIAAGADTVMVGSLFSGTNEAPGEIHVSGEWPAKKVYKMYRGSASESMKLSMGKPTTHVEGTAKMVPVKGPVVSIVNEMVEGLTSSMSYLGVDTISKMHAAAKFIQITQAGMVEATPHLLNGS